MATTETPAGTSRRPQLGPPLPIPVAVFAVLTVLGVIINRSVPHADAAASAVLAYTQDSETTIRLGSFLLFGSSVPLTVATAVVYRRLRALGITAPGAAIAFAGGLLASVALALSGFFMWTEGRLAGDAPPALAKALSDMSFMAGGPGFAIGLALLIAGISVPGLLAGLLPRPLAIIGLVIGVAGAIGTLTLVTLSVGPALPVVRFGGTLWLLAAAFLLPRTRRPRHT